jgi:hypothetical protein
MIKIFFNIFSIFYLTIQYLSYNNILKRSAVETNLHLREKDKHTRWAGFENPKGEKGKGGMENAGGKGRAILNFEPGQSHVLMEAPGPGIINRFWITFNDRSAESLRSLRLDMYWDNSGKPAVSVPVGDFFIANLGKLVAFESVLLTNPEGRSFNSFFKMPFLENAKIVFTNESSKLAMSLAYDVEYTLCPLDTAKTLYFHAFWNRENPTKLARDYTILPKVHGEGKFIGTSMGVLTDPGYGDSWFGEGEIKIYLDGDDVYPTLCGSGTEDYIGTAWEEGVFSNMTQGCLVADITKGMFNFYRLHVPDPVYFHDDIKVQIQVLGGARKDKLLKLIEKNLPVKIVSRANFPEFEQLLEKSFTLTPVSQDGWYNYYREDDFSSVAYFYFDKPCSDLPALPELPVRLAGIRE